MDPGVPQVQGRLYSARRKVVIADKSLRPVITTYLKQSIRLPTLVYTPLDTLLPLHCSLDCFYRLSFLVRHGEAYLLCMRLLLIPNTTNRSPSVPEYPDPRDIPSPQPQQPWTSSLS